MEHGGYGIAVLGVLWGFVCHAQENTFQDFERRYRERESELDRDRRFRFRGLDLKIDEEKSELDKFLDEQRKKELEEEMKRWESFDFEGYSRLIEKNNKLYEIAERFKHHVNSRLRNNVEFANVDIEDPSTVQRLDDFGRNEFNDFMKKRFMRAGEWYLANLLDPEADELRDILPEELRNFKFFKFGTLRFGKSNRAPIGISNLDPIGKGNGTLDPSADSTVSHPYVDAGTRFDPEALGELRFNLRLRGSHVGSGVGWRPWPEAFPVQFRADYDYGLKNDQQSLEASALLDLYDIWTGKREHKEHFYLYARWDVDENEGWFGIMFESGPF